MTVNTLLLVVGILLFLLAALLAFGTISGGVSVLGLISLGAAFFAAAHLPL